MSWEVWVQSDQEAGAWRREIADILACARKPSCCSENRGNAQTKGFMVDLWAPPDLEATIQLATYGFCLPHNISKLAYGVRKCVQQLIGDSVPARRTVNPHGHGGVTTVDQPQHVDGRPLNGLQRRHKLLKALARGGDVGKVRHRLRIVGLIKLVAPRVPTDFEPKGFTQWRCEKNRTTWSSAATSLLKILERPIIELSLCDYVLHD
jgi:hypothetical protein